MEVYIWLSMWTCKKLYCKLVPWLHWQNSQKGRVWFVHTEFNHWFSKHKLWKLQGGWRGTRGMGSHAFCWCVTFLVLLSISKVICLRPIWIGRQCRSLHIMCMYISCVGLCVHIFMNPMLSWFVCVFLRRFNVLCYASGFYMLLFLRQLFMMHVCVCVFVCVCVCVCLLVSVCVCVCVCVCVLLLFIGIVQRSWACLTLKAL